MTTIAAVATPPGFGGVGIVRVSGPAAKDIAQSLLGFMPTPRHAHYCDFLDAQGRALDQGIALLFTAPHSFTGEDVLELQGHGGPVVLDLLLQRIYALGVRPARAGEFSERAFLNDKMDLAQAEAISDLIHAQSQQAAKAAMRSLCGDFSKTIEGLQTSLTALRTYVEAAIDFPDEEIDFLTEGAIEKKVAALQTQVQGILKSAEEGALLQEGVSVAIIGKPNAGKSSLLNRLSGEETAIVTDIPGTTRDIVKETIHLEGIPLKVIDTAGLRETEDKVEQEGVVRAMTVAEKADVVIVMRDKSDDAEALLDITPHIIVDNKIDLVAQKPSTHTQDGVHHVALSVKTGEGMDLLKAAIKTRLGLDKSQETSGFSARRRHVTALSQTLLSLDKARTHVLAGVGELAAEELRLAQEAVSTILGTYRADDLLGEIFSSFCIGK